MFKKLKTKTGNLKTINKISFKLALIFALMILLLLFIWGLGIVSIYKVNTESKNLYSNNTQGISYITELSKNPTYNYLSSKLLINTKDNIEKNNIIENIKYNDSSNLKLIDLYTNAIDLESDVEIAYQDRERFEEIVSNLKDSYGNNR